MSTPDETINPYYSTAKIGRLLGYSAQTIINYCSNGRIKFERVGERGPRRIKHSDFVEFLNAEGMELPGFNIKVDKGAIDLSHPIVAKRERLERLSNISEEDAAKHLNGIIQIIKKTHIKRADILRDVVHYVESMGGEEVSDAKETQQETAEATG